MPTMAPTTAARKAMTPVEMCDLCFGSGAGGGGGDGRVVGPFSELQGLTYATYGG